VNISGATLEDLLRERVELSKRILELEGLEGKPELTVDRLRRLNERLKEDQRWWDLFSNPPANLHLAYFDGDPKREVTGQWGSYAVKARAYADAMLDEAKKAGRL
jgi:hypothetical protein